MFPELLTKGLAGIVDLSAAQMAVLQAHYELLLRWNQSLSLTTITAIESAVTRHYCESLFLAAHLPAGALRIADIGSGPASRVSGSGCAPRCFGRLDRVAPTETCFCAKPLGVAQCPGVSKARRGGCGAVRYRDLPRRKLCGPGSALKKLARVPIY